MLTNSVRIIGGEWRRRRLHFSPSLQLRPTSDRVRETLFNWLNPVIQNAVCFDPFAGSGALGFEALSRGADWVTFLDRSSLVVKQLNYYLAVFQAEKKGCVHLNDFPKKADQIPKNILSRPIDLIFLDPPFKQSLLEDSLNWIEKHCLLSSNAQIYIEHEAELVLPEFFNEHWTLIKQKKAGQVIYGLWRKNQVSINYNVSESVFE